jgi:hypothetical protein
MGRQFDSSVNAVLYNTFYVHHRGPILKYGGTAEEKDTGVFAFAMDFFRVRRVGRLACRVVGCTGWGKSG